MSAPSYDRGSTAIPLLDQTIGQTLAQAAGERPDAEALVSVHQGVRLTWAQLHDQAKALACGLLELGLEPGDRVGVWAPNCAEWTLVQFATALVGMIQVNVNPAYRLSEVEYALNKAGVKALVCPEAFKTSHYAEMIETLAPELATAPPGELRAKRLPDLRVAIQIGGTIRSGWTGYGAVASAKIDQASLDAIAAGLGPDDAINIQFTSGTTGSPKGATLSHRNILNNGYFVGLGEGLVAGDRLCIPVPLYHCFGMVMGNLACLAHGATMIYPSAGFEPLAVLQTVQAERCTALYGVPTMFIAELAEPSFETFDLSTLRTGLMAGSPCPVEVMRQVRERMNMRDVGIAYGMTETSPVSMQTACDDPVDRRISTVGRVQPHVEVKIVDAEGNTVPRGETGEFCTRGYSVMLGYWDDAERTAEAVDAEGYMHTGDLAVMDDAGYGAIVGRIKDMVIRGGENVYPREVEEYLYTHPRIADVQVVGVPDARYGEEICAWIRIKPGEDLCAEDVTAYCRGQIAHYKVPRYVRFVDEFPLTVTGKVQKFLIRQAMIEELGLAEA
jgi:fatty-acyl-CoA synthase